MLTYISYNFNNPGGSIWPAQFSYNASTCLVLSGGSSNIPDSLAYGTTFTISIPLLNLPPYNPTLPFNPAQYCPPLILSFLESNSTGLTATTNNWVQLPVANMYMFQLPVSGNFTTAIIVTISLLENPNAEFQSTHVTAVIPGSY